jgi:hypothetical protein
MGTHTLCIINNTFLSCKFFLIAFFTKIYSLRFLDRINRMYRMLSAGRKPVAADNNPSPATRGAIRWKEET